MPIAKREPPLRCGQWVRVRDAQDIAATLDASGCLDGMPFMPEMAQLCGQHVRVFRRADVTCVEGVGMRRLANTVFLEQNRCDGAAHDGCQRGCLMFWKEAWLAPAAGPAVSRAPAAEAAGQLVRRLPTRDGDRYVCQSTALAAASRPLTGLGVAHLLAQWRQGEVSTVRVLRIAGRVIANRIRKAGGWRGLGFLGGSDRRPSRGELQLQSGEPVSVKQASQIAAFLDPHGRNNGLSFEPDMLALAGCPARVAQPIRKIILEQTGTMATLTNTVTLDGVLCSGSHARNCPRANPLFWRESWLERDAGT